MNKARPSKTRGPRGNAKTMKLAEEPEPMELCEVTAPVVMALPAGVDNIDLDDAQNPQLVADYVGEIDGYMKKLEVSSTFGHFSVTGLSSFGGRPFSTLLRRPFGALASSHLTPSRIRMCALL